MIEKTLKSGRKVSIRNISLDQEADLNDIPEIKFNNGGVPLDFKMYLSETAMIDPLQAFKIKNLDQILKWVGHLSLIGAQ